MAEIQANKLQFLILFFCDCSLTNHLIILGEVGQLKKHYEGFHNWFQFYRLQTTTNELSNVQATSVTYNTEVRYYLDNVFLIK